MRAVRFDSYGGPEVLEVREVDDPVAGPGQVVVRVRAAGINPGEIAIRSGAMAEQFPATFPSGEGSDLAGVVEAVADDVEGVAVGDEVTGWTDERGSHAELVAVPAEQVLHKPSSVSWEVAGALYVAGLAGLAGVRAVAPQPGEVVVVSAAAGGVGGVSAQLARATGARVLGLASEANHAWLRSRGIEPVAYGEGQRERLEAVAPEGVDALIDTFGGGYADLAIALGVPVGRINTVIDFEAVGRLGISALGTSGIASPAAYAELVARVADGTVEVPIAATYPLEEVRAAYEDLARRRTRGKVVLLP